MNNIEKDFHTFASEYQSETYSKNFGKIKLIKITILISFFIRKKMH